MSKTIIERLKKTCHSIHRPRRPPELFRYEPLGRQESALRLITVLPDLSTEGQIQCSLYNTSSRTPRSFSCLSYTWGSPRTKRAVLINGFIFYVQPNVFNFLDIARTMLCHEKNDIKVDYGCPVSEFIHSILGSCAETSCLCATMEVMESLTTELAVQDDLDLNCKTGPDIEFNMHAGMTSCMLLQILEDVLPDQFRVCKDTARLSLWDLWNLHQEKPIFRLCRKCDRPDLSILRGTRDFVQATGFGYGTLSF